MSKATPVSLKRPGSSCTRAASGSAFSKFDRAHWVPYDVLLYYSRAAHTALLLTCGPHWSSTSTASFPSNCPCG